MLTETELNALAAKLVKAELLGNEEQVAVLRGRLEAARAARAAHVAAGGDPDTQTQVPKNLMPGYTYLPLFSSPVCKDVP